MAFTLMAAAIFIVPLAFLAQNTFRRAFAANHRLKRLSVLTIGLVVGIAAGCWFGSTFTYQASDTMRLVGLPLPCVAFHLENGQWVCFVTPMPGLNAILNLIIITLLTLAPLNIVFRFPRDRHNVSKAANSNLDQPT